MEKIYIFVVTQHLSWRTKTGLTLVLGTTGDPHCPTVGRRLTENQSRTPRVSGDGRPNPFPADMWIFLQDLGARGWIKAVSKETAVRSTRHGCADAGALAVRWVWPGCETVSGGERGCWRWPWLEKARLAPFLIISSLLCYRKIFSWLLWLVSTLNCQIISLKKQSVSQEWIYSWSQFL